MEKKPEKNHAEDWLKDLPVRSENPAFKEEEMILCEKCGRKSPPTRISCFYCGKELPISTAGAENIKPHLRKLENWEKGFNLIYLPTEKSVDEAKFSDIGRMLGLENTELQKIVSAGRPLPIGRAEFEKEAEIARLRLKESGIETLIVSDEKLAVEKPLKRLRGLEFSGDRLILILFNQQEAAEMQREDLALIVSGVVFEQKSESVHKRKKGRERVLDTMETSTDEMLIDIYSRMDSNGFRILINGFDFSCLEGEKGILAGENMKKLAEKLREFAPEARFVNDYFKLREMLGSVWEIEHRSDPQGLKRHGFGKFDFAKIASSNNLQQFTKYSRLQWHLL